MKNWTPEAEQARKMALSPLLSLTFTPIYTWPKQMIECKGDSQSFNGWEGDVIDPYRQVTMEQRVDPRGLVSVLPLDAEAAKKTFAKLGIDMARLHIARTPITTATDIQQEAAKLIRSAWDVDGALAQVHVNRLNIPEVTALAKQSVLDWDIVNTKRLQPQTVRSEFEAHQALIHKQPRGLVF